MKILTIIFKKILSDNKLLSVDFHTVWCDPCRKMAPIVNRIETDYKNKEIATRIGGDKSKEVGKTYNVVDVSVFILYKEGKEAWAVNGIISKEKLIKQLEQYL